MVNNIFLAPVSTIDFEYQFKRPVIEGIEHKQVTLYSQNPILDKNENERLSIWGVKEYKKRFWEMAQHGDVILFYNTGRLRFSARIIQKEMNEKLAIYIWGKGHFIYYRKKNVWPFLFFLDNIKACEIPFDVIRKLSNYSENYFLRTFIALRPEARDSLYAKYNTIENFVLRTSV